MVPFAQRNSHLGSPVRRAQHMEGLTIARTSAQGANHGKYASEQDRTALVQDRQTTLHLQAICSKNDSRSASVLSQK